MNFLKKHRCGPLALLHCVSQYPTKYEDVHLRSMVTLQEVFGGPSYALRACDIDGSNGSLNSVGICFGTHDAFSPV